MNQLPDHLNAEIILGTVTNLREAVSWLAYTYLYTRMLRNPHHYGIGYEELGLDSLLGGKRRALIIEAAKTLMRSRMVKYDMKSGNFFSTDVGRVASYYYIHHESIEHYNKTLKNHMSDEEIIHLLATSKEFENIKVRDEELSQLQKLAKQYCPIKIRGSPETNVGKANVLLQTYISQGFITTPTLISDSYYIQQSAGRITRALFEMVLKRGKIYLASRLLLFCKMIDKRQWDFQSPLRQFKGLKDTFIRRIEESGIGVDRLVEMTGHEVGSMVKSNGKGGNQVLYYCNQLPYIDVSATVQPVTRAVLRCEVTLPPNFQWKENVHGGVQPFWVWVEDPVNEHIYHTEYFLLHKAKAQEEHKLCFTIPIFEPLPNQYLIRCVSDRWLGSETVFALDFEHLILPELYPPHTKLLDLQPLPISALMNKKAESMYSFQYFNPIQTQVFHALYHTDENIFLGAPTGSGKTLIAELAIYRLLLVYPGLKVVYIAPMKALARERVTEWGKMSSLRGKMGVRMVELTGDSNPDPGELHRANLLITTPEKWDGVSRSWKTRSFVKQVALVIIDEIHLLGQDRGPVLEVIVSRMRYISSHTAQAVRIVGLSTALSNAQVG